MVILDTSILIDHLRQFSLEKSALYSLLKNKSIKSLALSVISIQELYEGKSTLMKEKEEDLLTTISLLKILPYTYEIAELAGKIMRDSKKPIQFADAAIAASAIINGYKLLTFNKKDFSGIDDLRFL